MVSEYKQDNTLNRVNHRIVNFRNLQLANYALHELLRNKIIFDGKGYVQHAKINDFYTNFGYNENVNKAKTQKKTSNILILPKVL